MSDLGQEREALAHFIVRIVGDEPEGPVEREALSAARAALAAREEPQGEEHAKRVDPALPLLCPERKRFGGISDKGATFLISMEDGRCELCGWKAQDHVRA